MSAFVGTAERSRKLNIAAAFAMEGLESRRLFAAGDSAIVGKVLEYTQTSDTAPTVPTAYEATADVNENASGTAITSGTLTLPEVSGTPPQPLSEEEDVSHWGTQGNFDTQADLDSAVPGGTYELNVVDVNGNHTFTMTMPDSDEFPSAPAAVTGFAALQDVNASQDLTINWSPLGGTTSDYVSINIGSANGNVFRSPNIGAVGALDGTSTSIEIPAGTLQPGVTYTAQIVFAQIAEPVDTTDYPGMDGTPGVDGYIAFATDTKFSIVTQSDLTAPTGLSASQGTYAHHTIVSWAAVAGAASYQVYRSTVDNFAVANKVAGGLTGTTFTDIDVVAGVLHYYWIVARNGLDIGPVSAAVSGFTALPVPANVQASDYPHHVQLTWNPEPALVTYQVFRSITDDFNTSTRIATGILSNSFADTTGQTGVSYYYWIRAKNILGVSEPSVATIGATS